MLNRFFPLKVRTPHFELGLSFDEALSRLRRLSFVEEYVRAEGFSEDVSNAACTCFLENIAGEVQLADVSKYLGPESREFFDQWN